VVKDFLANNDSILSFGNKIALQINDTHAALLVPELMRILVDEHDLSWDDAWKITNEAIAYTNHTVLGEALEKWPAGLLRDLLPRQYNIIETINLRFCNKIRAEYSGDEERIRRMSIIQDDQVKMAHLAIVGGHSVNGVAALSQRNYKK